MSVTARARLHYMPLPIEDTERVVSAKLLGVSFQDNFKMGMHVNFVLSQRNQRLYLLKLLRCQGLSTAQLDQVSQVLTVSRLRYASSGFLTANSINRIQSTLKRLYRFGYTAQPISFNDIVKSGSVDLFHSMRKSNHCLHELLSSYTQRSDMCTWTRFCVTCMVQ